MMSTRVLFYGNSLLLSLVAENLGLCPELQVAQITTWPETGNALVENPPDVLIFDLTGSSANRVFLLLRQIPSLLLIGLDPETNYALLLVMQRAHSLTLSQIRQIIQDKDLYLDSGLALDQSPI